MKKNLRRRYRAYRETSRGSDAIRHPKHKGMLTFTEAVALAKRSKGCATVGYFAKGAHYSTTVWVKSSCSTKTRRAHGLNGARR